MTWPTIAVWILLLGGLWSRGPALVYLFGLLGCLGSLQMLAGDSFGGVNVLPQFACAAVLVCKAAIQRGNAIRMIAVACDPARAGFFTAYFLYCMTTALTLPVIFGKQVEVVPIAGAYLSGTSLLASGSGNATQPAYLFLTLATVVTFAVLGVHPGFRRAWLLSILFGGMALIVAGLADLASATFGLASLLEPFRTASYALLTDNEILGAKRVVGLQPEASAFGSSCVVALGMLTFLRPCFEPISRRIVVPLTMAGLAIMVGLSTSSSAYIGLVFFLLGFGLNWIIRASSLAALAREDLGIELAVAGLCLFIVFALAILFPTLLTPVTNMIDQSIFEKTTSESYVVRSMWTRVAWDAFVSTHFLGAGYGSVRSSNWVVSIFANSGLLGALLLLCFALRSAFAPVASVAPADIETTRALRLGFIPWLAMFWFAGTIPEIGVAAGSTLGIILAMTSRGKSEGAAPVVPLGRRKTSHATILPS